MPFDAVIAVPPLDRLSDALENNGISPVHGETLTAHKLEQLEKFAPSFWYRHPGLVLFACLIVFAVMVTIDGLGRLPASLLAFASLGAICPLVASLFATFRAGSHWVERMVPRSELDRLGVPEPIATMARKLHQDVPGSDLILGELVQDRTVLDPYLLLEYGHRRVCLGIWDGRRIIACAGKG